MKHKSYSSAARRQRTERLRRGQSMVEMSLSMVLLIFLFQGVWDLGRAYFALVHLNDAISEGAHWAAIYPACIAYAQDSFAGVVYPADPNAHLKCDGSNSVVGRIINEDETLNQANFKHVCWSTTTGGFSNTNNNTVTLSVTYNAAFISPFISGLFGSSIPLTTEVHEVIRGGTSDLPPTPVQTGGNYQGSVSSLPCTPP